MGIFENPRTVADNSGKMSSYEPHLMTMFTLTPKVIGLIKELAPDTKLVGFKLLDGVEKEELLKVATKLRQKNRADDSRRKWNCNRMSDKKRDCTGNSKISILKLSGIWI